MDRVVFNPVTGKYDLTLKKAVKLNLIMQPEFKVRPGYTVFAKKDKRTKSGINYELTKTPEAYVQEIKKSKVLNITNFTIGYKPLRTRLVMNNEGNIETEAAEPFEAPLKLMLQHLPLLNKPFTIDILHNGRLIESYPKNRSGQYQFKEVTDFKNFIKDIWIGKYYTMQWNNSNGTASSREFPFIQEGNQVRLNLYEPLSPNYIKQYLRKGDSHCILQPIINHFQTLVNNAECEKTKRNYMPKLKKAQSYLQKYANGVEFDDEMETFAKELNIKIIVQDVILNELRIFNRYGKKAKQFNYINSSLHHGDYVDICLNIGMEAERISFKEGVKMIETLLENDEYCIYKGSMKWPSIIITTSGKYICTDSESDDLINFIRSFDKGFKLDYITQKPVCEYIKSGLHLVVSWKNTHYAGPSDLHALEEIDMKKAYSQFKKCEHYKGFPSIINNFRSVPNDWDTQKYLGVYTINIKENENKHLQAIGIHTGLYTLSSPILAILKKHNIKFNVKYGAYSTKSYDFEFPKELIETKMYQIWPGFNLHFEDIETYKMKCTKEFAGVVKSQMKEDMYYCDLTNTLLIHKPKEHHKILPHIATFVVSYTHATIIEEMMKYDISRIYGTKLDSILIHTDTFHPLQQFNTAVFQREESVSFSEYPSTEIFTKSEKIDIPKEKPYPAEIFLSGAGGTGKTHSVLTDKGFTYKSLYVSRAWDLIIDKMKEYNCFGTSVNKLVGKGIHGEHIRTYKDEYGSPAVIIWDEMSMNTQKEYDTLQSLYPYSQLIMIGDYSIKHKCYYQSRVSSEPMFYPKPEMIVTFTDDKRSANEETKQFKEHIRNLMETKRFSAFALKEYLLATLPTITRDSLKDVYNKDYILTGTNKQCMIFTELLKSEDIQKNHYRTTKTILNQIEKPDTIENIKGKEIKHGFTVHSFQGRTIQNRKCFLDIHNLDNAQDIYTGISRVRDMADLVCIVY